MPKTVYRPIHGLRIPTIIYYYIHPKNELEEVAITVTSAKPMNILWRLKYRGNRDKYTLNI